jgi:hypothetical protein
MLPSPFVLWFFSPLNFVLHFTVCTKIEQLASSASKEWSSAQIHLGCTRLLEYLSVTIPIL